MIFKQNNFGSAIRIIGMPVPEEALYDISWYQQSDNPAQKHFKIYFIQIFSVKYCRSVHSSSHHICHYLVSGNLKDCIYMANMVMTVVDFGMYE